MSTAAKAMIASTGESRLTRRRIVNLAAHARDMKAPIFDIQVVDISTAGCRILATRGFEAGAEIWLQIPGLTIRQARIAWSEGGEAGCEFTTPIDEQLLRENGFNRRGSVVKRDPGAFGSASRR